MTHGSLFSGIGGFDLAAEWMGWENKFHCEWNPFGQKVLHYYWPNAQSFNDITKTDFTPYANGIDILTAGFPCQPYSGAGKRKGKEDDRYLWPETRRAYREIQPGILVLENVAGLISILEPTSISEMENKAFQLFSEGSEEESVILTIESVERRVIATIIEEIESDGYLLPRLEDGTPIVLCIPACSLNAPHRRDRVWFVAYRNGYGQQRSNSEHEINPSKGREYAQYDIDQMCCNGVDTNTNSDRRQGRLHEIESTTSKQLRTSLCPRYMGRQTWEKFPTQPPLCNGNDGLPDKLDGITISKWRSETTKGGGNAIVPHIAYEIFKVVEHLKTAH